MEQAYGGENWYTVEGTDKHYRLMLLMMAEGAIGGLLNFLFPFQFVLKIMTRCWILSSAFYPPIEIDFILSLLVWQITLIGFEILNQHCSLGLNLTWS